LLLLMGFAFGSTALYVFSNYYLMRAVLFGAHKYISISTQLTKTPTSQYSKLIVIYYME
jgi:hypothetical protein